MPRSTKRSARRCSWIVSASSAMSRREARRSSLPKRSGSIPPAGARWSGAPERGSTSPAPGGFGHLRDDFCCDGGRLFPPHGAQWPDCFCNSPPRGGCMNETVEVTKLLELQESLPGRVQAAAQVVRDAELRLAQVLTKRAAGKSTGSSEVGGARMALSKALRDADDLQRVQSVLPAMLE